MKFGRCFICGMLFRRTTKKRLRLALKYHKRGRHPKEERARNSVRPEWKTLNRRRT